MSRDRRTIRSVSYTHLKKNDANDVVRLSSLIDAQFGHNELDNILEEALHEWMERCTLGECH